MVSSIIFDKLQRQVALPNSWQSWHIRANNSAPLGDCWHMVGKFGKNWEPFIQIRTQKRL